MSQAGDEAAIDYYEPVGCTLSVNGAMPAQVRPAQPAVWVSMWGTWAGNVAVRNLGCAEPGCGEPGLWERGDGNLGCAELGCGEPGLCGAWLWGTWLWNVWGPDCGGLRCVNIVGNIVSKVCGQLPDIDERLLI
jgi:hypothetical protein